MLLLDAGTTYSKTYSIKTKHFDIFPSKEINQKHKKYLFGTGHFSKKVAEKNINELVALSYGGLSLIKDDSFCLLDVGSRDVKYILIKNRKYHSSDWNQSCGAFTGFTIEMLGKYFKIDYSSIKPSATEMSATCGILGMSSIFDQIISGGDINNTIASFVRGVASSIHRFTSNYKKIYLSGGLCENNLFLNSFPVEVIPLGRFVIIEGLIRMFFNSTKTQEIKLNGKQ